MTDITQALKTLTEMITDGSFVQYLEHLESARTNRPTHQLAENLDALYETLVTARQSFIVGSTTSTSLTFATGGAALTLASGDINLTFPNVLGDGTTASLLNAVTTAQINSAVATLSSGNLAAGCWLVVNVDRAAGAAVAVVAFQSTADYQTALQTDKALALNYVPLAYCSGTHLHIFPSRVWLAQGEALRSGLVTYVGQAEADLVHANQVENFNAFMTGELVTGNPLQFSWNASTGALVWDGQWHVKGPADPGNATYGPFDNTVAAGNITLSAQGDVAYLVLDRTNATPARTAQTATTVPSSDRDNAFVFALWGDDDQIYLWDGTVIPSGASSPLGGSVSGVAWRIYGNWDGTTGSMPLATDATGARDITLEGSIVTPAQYAYGGHHIMVFVNGMLAKGGPSGSLANGDRYTEVDDGGGVGTTITWLSDPTGATAPGGVPINIPGTSDYVEVYLPMGSSQGTPGRWQAMQLVELSGAQSDSVTTGAAATYAGVVNDAPTGSAPNADWYGLADHAGARLVVTHDDGAGGDVQSSTADGDGTFTSTGGVDDGDAGTNYDPLTGTYNLVFSGGNRRVTGVDFRFLTAPDDEAHRIEGVTAPDTLLPIVVTGGFSATNYYADHPGADRTTLLLDGTAAGGVGSLEGMTGAINLVATGGVSVATDTPTPGDLTVSTADTVPLTGAGHGADAGDGLEAAFGGALADPSAGNPYVTAAQAPVAVSTDDKNGMQGLFAADPALAAVWPLLGVGALSALLRTHGIVVATQADVQNTNSAASARVHPFGAVLQPQVDGSRALALHSLRPTEALHNAISGNVVGAALAAGGGEWLWVYMLEQSSSPGTTFEVAITNGVDWLGYSINGPAAEDETAVDHGRMVYPTFTEIDAGRLAGVPVACFLTLTSTTLLVNQEMLYDTGVLKLPTHVDPLKFWERSLTAGSAKYTAAPGASGYLGLNGDSTKSLLPLNAAGKAAYVHAVRLRIEWAPATSASRAYVYFYSGDTSTDAAAFITRTVWFGDGGNQRDSREVVVPLPLHDHASPGIDLGALRHQVTVVGSGTLSMYLEELHFRPGFWGAS